jgi:hypothetical protein
VGLVSSYVRAHLVHRRAHVCVACVAPLRAVLVAAALGALGAAPRPAAPLLPRAPDSARTVPPTTLSFAACAPDAKTHFSVLVPIAVSANEELVARCCADTLRDALFDELRTRQGLLYSVRVSYVSHSPTAREHDACRAELQVYAMCAGANVAAAVLATRRVVESLAVTDAHVSEWRDAYRASVLASRACRTPDSLAAWYEPASLGGYELRSHDETLALLRAFPLARTRAVARALRGAGLRVYITTGDGRERVIREQLSRAARPSPPASRTRPRQAVVPSRRTPRRSHARSA